MCLTNLDIFEGSVILDNSVKWQATAKATSVWFLADAGILLLCYNVCTCFRTHTASYKMSKYWGLLLRSYSGQSAKLIAFFHVVLMLRMHGLYLYSVIGMMLLYILCVIHRIALVLLPTESLETGIFRHGYSDI